MTLRTQNRQFRRAQPAVDDRAARLTAAADQHRRGALDRALDGYRAVLKRWPNDPDALHLSGLVLHQQGRHADGLAAIDRAIALRPDAASFQANRGLALKALGRPDAAIAAFRRALDLRPDHAEAASNLGVALLEAGDPAAGLVPLQKAVAAAPGLLAPRLNLSRLLLRLGETDAALDHLAQAAMLALNDPAVLLAHAQALVVAGRAEEAISAAACACAAAPDSADALATHAAALLAGGHAADAAALARRVRERVPGHADAAATLGAALVALGRAAEAIPILEGVTAALPGWTPGWASLGRARSLAGDHAGAMAAHRRAIATEPRVAGHYADLGNAAQVAGDVATATAAFRDAVALAPGIPAYRLSLSLLRLLEDDGARGWPDYAARWQCEGFTQARRPLPQPHWHGEPLAGLRLAVTGEQGIGDEIMLAGLIPELQAAGADIVLEAHHRLVPLFARAFPDVIVVPALSPPAPALLTADRQVAAGDLLPHLRPVIADAPVWQAYLKADAAAVAAARARLAALGPGLKVGIAWRSGNKANGHRRSLPLEDWTPLLRTPGPLFVSLQYGDDGSEPDGIVLHRDATVDPLTDIDGFAALVAALDLVISIDNSTVHVAGALGVPVWALLPVSPDWRWLRDGDGPRWYGSIRLFRQEAPGDWSVPLDAARDALAALIRRETPPGRRPRPPAPARPRAVLLNDTSAWYHWGCTGTSTALRRQIDALGYAVDTLPINQTYALTEIPQSAEALLDGRRFAAFRDANPVPLRAMSDADVIVINGEGTLHGAAPAALGLLALAHAGAARLGKPVQIVNHSCYPPADPAARAIYAEVYRRLDHIAVREHRAYAVVAALGVSPALSFDCLPLFIAQEGIVRRAAPGKRILLAGSASIAEARVDLMARYIARMRRHGFSIGILTGAAAFPAEDDRLFVERLRAAADGWELVEAHSAAAWLQALADADLFVSGRFHHSIAATTLGTPFVAMQSNTAKIDALLELIEHRPALPLDAPDLAALLERESLATLATAPDPMGHAARVEALRLLAQVNFDGLRRLAPAAIRP